jgi:hypothetical protein
LSERLVNCAKEDCWLQEIKDFAEKEKWTNALFAPKIDRIWENSLMSTMTIKSVMKPYECDKYPDFVFMGPTPIDYDSKPRGGLNKQCVTEELCRFNLKEQLAKGKSKFGIVLNLDEHFKSGSHWTAMYVDAGPKDPVVFYFDSQGLTFLKVDGFKHKGKDIDRLVKMFVDQVWPDMKWGYFGGSQNAQVNLTFYVSDYAGQTPIAYGPFAMTEATTYITPRFRGRLVSIKMESNDVGSFWRIGNMRYRLQPDGKF